MADKAYIQHPGKVVEADGRFKHVMAIALDPRSDHKKGVIRCITSRDGDVEVKGYVDHSELYLITGSTLEHFDIGDRLTIKNEDQIMEKLTPSGWECIGLEDPDIFTDEASGLTHLYFTLPIKPPHGWEKMRVHLGHAVGNDLDSLEMTIPVLVSDDTFTAKEVSIAPVNSQGVRLNLIESRDRQAEETYSTVQVAPAEDMGKAWEYGETVFHPKEAGIPWISGHASPGPLFPKTFIDIGGNKLLGIINGREANKRVGDTVKYGIFSVGLFIYDYELGKIDWVSPEPFIRDTEAKTITFASQFVETGPGEGILYAHVDDSFVRAYTLNAAAIRSLLPTQLIK